MGWTVRSAAEEDLDALLALYVSYFRELETFGMPFTLDRDALPGVLRAKIKSRLILAAVAEGDGKLAGFCFCAISRLPKERRWRGEASAGFLEELYVVPEARRRGLASRLTDFAREWLRENQIGMITLEVLHGNPEGLAFWKKQGFAPVAAVCQQILE